MPERYAVMGHPIAHSRSPFIHRRFAAETGEPVAYDALLVEPDGFRDAVERFRAEGGRGLNVTIPFKEEAFALAGRRTDRAERAGAVNTLWFDGESVCGENTDGVGLVRDLTRNLEVELEARSVLLLGAGGAARGVIGPLLDEKPERLVIANRTVSRAVDLASRFEGQGPVSAASFDALSAGGFDIVVPNFYAFWDYAEHLKFGVGVTVPFGLVTDYELGWLGRYNETTTHYCPVNC